MKFQVTLKTPDAQDYAIESALEIVKNELQSQEENADSGLDPDDVEDYLSEKKDELKEFTDKWFRYGECVTIEFDTDTQTAKVISV